MVPSRQFAAAGRCRFDYTADECLALTLNRSEDDARAQINFPRHGTKWLALLVAKLTPVT